jgi:hypothetical protein
VAAFNSRTIRSSERFVSSTRKDFVWLDSAENLIQALTKPGDQAATNQDDATVLIETMRPSECCRASPPDDRGRRR